jgi:hypothetical protein
MAGINRTTDHINGVGSVLKGLEHGRNFKRAGAGNTDQVDIFRKTKLL